jgi:hypothetical protein
MKIIIDVVDGQAKMKVITPDRPMIDLTDTFIEVFKLQSHLHPHYRFCD